MSLYINGTNVSPQSTPCTSFQGIGLDNASIYAIGSNGKLYGCSITSNTPVWDALSIDSIPMPCTGIGLDNGSVYAIGSNGKLYGCSITSNTKSWYVVTLTTTIG